MQIFRSLQGRPLCVAHVRCEQGSYNYHGFGADLSAKKSGKNDFLSISVVPFCVDVVERQD